MLCRHSLFKSQRYWARFVIILAVIVIIYVSSLKEKEKKFARQREILPLRFQPLKCNADYQKDVAQFEGCVPKSCGRFVSDKLITEDEIKTLLQFAKAGLALGGSDGGASVMDLHSGALSKGKVFQNIFKRPEATTIFTAQNLLTYQIVKAKILQAIQERFDLTRQHVHLTYPTFFSRLTNVTSQTVHDEYWHQHIDKDEYPSFHYTTLLYLNDFGKDFLGGRFIFVDDTKTNKTISSIEPRAGRVLAFTSGAENVHFVEKVLSGERFTLAISFTCNEEFAIPDPKLRIEEAFEDGSKEEAM